jgi:hypothetical protein
MRMARRLRPWQASTAHHVVRKAILCGKLVPQACERCGFGGRTDAHHEDYAKPLVVTWLCRPCHVEQHQAKTRRKEPGEAPIELLGPLLEFF